MSLTATSSRFALQLAGIFRRRLSIVLFHHVFSAPDPLLPDEPDIKRFDLQLGWLKSAFDVLTVGEAAALLYAGKLPPRALCITFDDGYRDNALHALPVLQRHGLRATFFVTTRHLDGGMMWNDRVIAAIRTWPDEVMDLTEFGLGKIDLAAGRAAAVSTLLPSMKYLPFAARDTLSSRLFETSGAPDTRLMMNASEIAGLRDAGMEIGGHTESHPILATLPDGEARAQIERNKSALEAILGEAIVTFAYPNGRPNEDYDARHLTMLSECGYRYALTTAAGTATSANDPLQLPRFTPWDRDEPRYLVRLAVNYFRNAEVATSITGHG